MNANKSRVAQPSRMEEAPDTRPTVARPAEVLAILAPDHEVPRPILIGGLWKTGPLPEAEGAAS